jgi:hypothetical protein
MVHPYPPDIQKYHKLLWLKTKHNDLFVECLEKYIEFIHCNKANKNKEEIMKEIFQLWKCKNHWGRELDIAQRDLNNDDILRTMANLMRLDIQQMEKQDEERGLK